jgi:hypothetical protein
LQSRAPTSVAETEQEINVRGDIFEDYFPLSMSPSNVQHVQGNIADQLLGLTGNPEEYVSVFAQPGYPEHPLWTTLFEGEYVLSSEYTDLLLWYDPSNPGEVSLSPANASFTWVLSVPRLITCTRIQREDGTWMLRGVDFHSAPGVVALYEDPSVSFPSQKATACGFRSKTGSYNYTLQLDGITTPGSWVWKYYRNANGVPSFSRALAEASGLHVWYYDSHIVARQEMPVGYTYWTTQEKVQAWYPHTGLTVGSLVREGDIIVDPEDFSVSESNGELEITLSEPLFIGIYHRRAVEFIRREKPIGVPITVTLIEET